MGRGLFGCDTRSNASTPEIIAVNDGSTDSTGALMDQWKQSNAESDVRISIIQQML